MCLFIDIICNTLIFSTLVNKYYNKSSMAKILEVFWIRISLSELGCWDSNKLGPDQGSSLFQNRVRIWTKCTYPGSATLKLTMVQNEILKFNYTDKLRERKFGQQRACQSLPCIFCHPEFSIFFSTEIEFLESYLIRQFILFTILHLFDLNLKGQNFILFLLPQKTFFFSGPATKAPPPSSLVATFFGGFF